MRKITNRGRPRVLNRYLADAKYFSLFIKRERKFKFKIIFHSHYNKLSTYINIDSVTRLSTLAMQLERINAALRYLKRPRVDHFPLQLSQLGDLFKYPVWATNSKGTLLKNLDEPILFNPAFKLPTLQQLNLLYHHTIYESVFSQYL